MLKGETSAGDMVNTAVDNVPATLSDTDTEPTAANFELAAVATRDVVFLDIGDINLDLLGLVINLSPIELNIDSDQDLSRLFHHLRVGS